MRNQLKEQAFPQPIASSGSGVVVGFPEEEISVVDAYLRGLRSEGTRRVYRRAIDLLDAYLGEQDLREASRRDIEAWRAAQEQLGLSPSTISKRISAVSGLFEFLVDEGEMSSNPAARARRPKVPSESPRRGTTPKEVALMLSACDQGTLIGLRDRAIIVALATQGWRLSELLGLCVDDLGEEGGHRVAEIRGKGSKNSRVPLSAQCWGALRAWLDASGLVEGPVFVPVAKGGRVRNGVAMSSQAADKRIKIIAQRAGVPRSVHAHLFRHGAVTAALDAGVPLREVQDFARHADPRTTRRYDSHRQSLANPTSHVLGARLLGG